MASRSRALAPLLRRSIVSSRTSNALMVRGGATPPLPSFKRIPPMAEKLVENNDCIFDDGVAPELALDFDLVNVSTAEAIGTWVFGFSCFYALFQFIKATHDEKLDDPAVKRNEGVFCVVPDHGMIGKAPTTITGQLTYPYTELTGVVGVAAADDDEDDE